MAYVFIILDTNDHCVAVEETFTEVCDRLCKLNHFNPLSGDGQAMVFDFLARFRKQTIASDFHNGLISCGFNQVRFFKRAL